MSEPTYTVIVTESERTALAKVLGGLVTKLINAPVFVEAKPSPPTQAPASSTPPPRPAQPREVRTRWAKDRQGKELPFPEGCYEVKAHLWKVEQVVPRTSGKKSFTKVTWEANPPARGHVDANCFDPDLHTALFMAQGSIATLYVVRNDKYFNVVGIVV